MCVNNLPRIIVIWQQTSWELNLQNPGQKATGQKATNLIFQYV